MLGLVGAVRALALLRTHSLTLMLPIALLVLSVALRAHLRVRMGIVGLLSQAPFRVCWASGRVLRTTDVVLVHVRPRTLRIDTRSLVAMLALLPTPFARRRVHRRRLVLDTAGG